MFSICVHVTKRVNNKSGDGSAGCILSETPQARDAHDDLLDLNCSLLIVAYEKYTKRAGNEKEH